MGYNKEPYFFPLRNLQSSEAAINRDIGGEEFQEYALIYGQFNNQMFQSGVFPPRMESRCRQITLPEEGMMTIILSLVLALLCTTIPWGTKQSKSWPIAIVLGVSIVLSILGTTFSAAWYPWTDIVVLLAAVTAGLLLGRAMSAKLWPFLLLLLVLSTLDIVQIVLTTHASAPSSQSASVPAAQLYGNFLLNLPWGRYNIGIFDLWLITAMAEYWRKRGSEFLVALAPGVIGIVLAFAVIQFIYAGILPLIPFLTVGWLCSAGIYHYHNRPKKAFMQPH